MKCLICMNEFDDINSHIKSHGISPVAYYYKYVYQSHKCNNCGNPIEYRHSLNKTLRSQFCNKSCQVSYRNKVNSLNGTNPFQPQNLIRDEFGGSIRHKIGHESAIKSGKFNWMNNGTEECKLRLSKMHKITASHQIDNGNSIFSTQFHSSKEELYFGTKLGEFGIKYISQYHDMRWSKRYLADYYLPEYNLIIEIDGDFKYKNGKLDQCYIDREDLIFKESGIKIIHIKTSQVYSIDFEKLIKMISESSTTIER